MLKYLILLLFNYQFHASIVCVQEKDSIEFKNRSEFDRFINYSFMNSTENLSLEIRKQVVTIFDRYDFSGDEYDCQYRFNFIVDIDSLGFIKNCTPVKDESHSGRISLFENDICLMIVKSNSRIRNKVELLDTCYTYLSTIFVFETSCDPDEVIFNNQSIDHELNKQQVFFVRSKKGDIYFDGFKYNFTESEH